MKTLRTVEEVKAEAARDNNATFFLELNEQIVTWMLSEDCHGENRRLKPSNVEYWAKRLADNSWRTGASDMKINASCTWLLDGHHRAFAIAQTKKYGVCTRMSVIPDNEARAVFGDQDCSGSSRSIADQFRMRGGIGSTNSCAIEKVYRECVKADITRTSVDSAIAFQKEHMWYFNEGFHSIRPSARLRVPPVFSAAFIYAVEKMPDEREKLKTLWRKIVLADGLRVGSSAHAFYRYMNDGAWHHQKKDFVIALNMFREELQGVPRKHIAMGERQYNEVADFFGLTTVKTKLEPHLVSGRAVQIFDREIRNAIAMKKEGGAA